MLENENLKEIIKNIEIEIIKNIEIKENEKYINIGKYKQILKKYKDNKYYENIENKFFLYLIVNKIKLYKNLRNE